VFGMLDYRAHKLFWLICFPFRFVAVVSSYAILLASIFIAHSTSYSVPVKILVAFASMLAINLLIFGVFWPIIFSCIRRLFFWFIDVVPAHGADDEEARTIVLRGPTSFRVTKKFDCEIENWTAEDTRALLKLLPWRVTMLFNPKERLELLVAELKRVHRETGKEPRDLGGKAKIAEIREKLPGGHIPWPEQIVTDELSCNLAISLVIIILGVSLLDGETLVPIIMLLVAIFGRPLYLALQACVSGARRIAAYAKTN